MALSRVFEGEIYIPVMHSRGGYQAIQIAYQQGATHIILLGYDMQHTGGQVHFHGDHPEGWPNFAGPERWIDQYNDLAAQAPVAILNCTRESALTQFPRMSIEDAAELIDNRERKCHSKS